MAKCKNCKKLDYVLNSGVPVGRWCVEKCDSPDIERERSCCKYVPMTNADRIRSMTDDELAEHFSGLIRDTKELEYCQDKDDWLKWLKQEVGGV